MKDFDNWVIDDITGQKYPASEMRELSGDQKGLLTHKKNWNPAHPQLYIKGRADKQNVEKVRLRGPDLFPTPPNPEDL